MLGEVPPATSFPLAQQPKMASSAKKADDEKANTASLPHDGEMTSPHDVEMQTDAHASISNEQPATTRNKLILAAVIILFVALLCVVLFVGVRVQDTDERNKGCTATGMTVRDPETPCLCYTTDLWICTPPADSNMTEPSGSLHLELPSYSNCTLVAYTTEEGTRESTTLRQLPEPDTDDDIIPVWRCDGNAVFVFPPLFDDTSFGSFNWEWLQDAMEVGDTCLRQKDLEQTLCHDPLLDEGIQVGRPLFNNFGKVLLADRVHVTASDDDWLGSVVVAKPRSQLNATGSCDGSNSLSSDESSRLVKMWEQAARYEHASVASFSKFSLQLMAVGAPPALVLGAHTAAIEEIGHAKLCFQTAQAISLYVANSDVFTTPRQTVGQLHVPHSLEVSRTTSELAYSTAIEGAVGETLAAFVAAVLHHDASVLLQETTDNDADVALTQVVDALATIMYEEGSHAALAWRTLDWAIDHQVKNENQQDIIRAIERAFKEQRVDVESKFRIYSQVGTDVNEPAVGWGQMGTYGRSRLDHAVFNEVIDVLLRALLNRTLHEHNFLVSRSSWLEVHGAESVVNVLKHISDLLKNDE